MNVAPNLYEWGVLFALIFVSITTVALLAAMAAHWAGSSAWSRTVWRAAVFSSLVVLGGELTGLSGGISQWTFGQMANRYRAAPLFARTSTASSSDLLAVLPPRGSSTIHWDELELDGLLESLAPAAQSGGDTDSPEIGPSNRTSLNHWAKYRTWLPGIAWGLIGLAIVTRVVAGRLLVLAWRRRAKPLDGSQLSRQLGSLSRHFEMRSVRIVEIAGIRGPVAFGIFRPTVGVPPEFTMDFDDLQQKAMLAHELEHLASRDPVWHLIADFAAAVAWWHPFVWWMRWRMRAASEWAADEASRLVPDGPEVLARCLVRIGRRMLHGERPAWLAIQGTGFRSGLGRRVARLLNLENQPWRRARGPALIPGRILITAALVTVSLLSTSWLSLDDTLKGDSMQMALHQSWRQSLAAAALFGVFGVGDASLSGTAAAADNSEEPAISIPEPQKDSEKEAAQKHARAIAEKLKAMQAQMDDLKQAGKNEELEKLARESRELKAMLEKLGDIAAKDDPPVLRRKIQVDSIDALRERLEQLEAENMKLRRALEETKRNADEVSAGRGDLERARKELHDKILRSAHEQSGDSEKARAVYEKLMRDYEDQAKSAEWAAKAKEMLTVKEKIERLAAEQSKLVEKGRGEEADKIKQQIRELMEAAEKSKAKFSTDTLSPKAKDVGDKVFKSKGDMQSAGRQSEEFVAMLKDLRDEVSRLRNEVTELRQLVKEGGGKSAR